MTPRLESIDDWLSEAVADPALIIGGGESPSDEVLRTLLMISRRVYREARRHTLKDRALLIDTLINDAHGAATAAGWHNDPDTGEPLDRNFGEMIALIHSEFSEALEAHRKDLADDKLPQFHGTTVELIDGIIRSLDTLGKLRADNPDDARFSAGDAYVAKRDFNDTRPDHKPENRAKKHGKKF